MDNSVGSNVPLNRKQAKKAAKRKKMEALLRIAALNDQDRQAEIINQAKIEAQNTSSDQNNPVQESQLNHILNIPGRMDTSDSIINSDRAGDGPKPKRRKPDTVFDSLENDQEMHACANMCASPIPSNSLGSFQKETFLTSSSNGATAQQDIDPNELRARRYPFCQAFNQENPNMQFPKSHLFFPHLINVLTPVPLVPTPTLFLPEALNVPTILGNSLHNNNNAQFPNCISGPNPTSFPLHPAMCGAYVINNPMLLPNMNVRVPNFPVQTIQVDTQLQASGSIENIDEDLQNLRKSLKSRYREFRATPHFYVSGAGETALLSLPQDARVPIFVTDIQRLILRAIIPNNSVESRCGYFKHLSKLSGIKILLMEGISVRNIENNPELTSLSEENYPHQMECVMPSAYQGALLEELAAVPLNPADRRKLISKYGSLEAALKHSKQVFRVLRAFFPIKDSENSSKKEHSKSDEGPPQENRKVSNKRKKSRKEKEEKMDVETKEEDHEEEASSSHHSDKFPRTHLLLSVWQMIEEGYPLPLRGNIFKQFADFRMTKTEYKEVSADSPMYGLDCEMCLTTIRKNELTRVSVINEKHEVVYDTLVLPPNKIINYLTEFSGITKEMMVGVTTTLQDVQDKLSEILEPDAILVGQSLNMDLIALKLLHPYVIDTSVIFNMSGDRGRKSKLRVLAKAFLNVDIQGHVGGHDPTEDAATALKLVQLKLAKSLEFGDAVLSQLKNCQSSYMENVNLEYTGEQPSIASKRKRKATEDNIKPEESDIFASVFRYLNRHTVNIIGQPEVIDEYHRYIFIANQNGTHNDKGTLYRPTTIRISNEEDIIDKAVQYINQSFITIAHIRMEQSASQLIAVRDKEMTERFNTLISDFTASVPENSLAIIILGGNNEGANGAVCLSIRKRKFTRTRHLATQSK